jgi:hypothetical protein
LAAAWVEFERELKAALDHERARLTRLALSLGYSSSPRGQGEEN